MSPRQQNLPRARRLSLLLPVLAVTLLATGEVLAQQGGTISGRVVAQSGVPISAAQIFIADLEIGALTQQNGRYVLLNVPAGTHTVQFERIGYRAMTVDVTVIAGGTMQQDFTVAEDALQLDEIIVTGTPGGTQRRAIGNTVARIDASEILASRPISSMQNLIQGRTPGLAFVRTGGQVGEGSIIRIRGVSSFGLGSQPLIYIDGVRMDNSMGLGPNLPNTGAGQRAASALDDLNPNDIESIEIIKGPAAATLYGTEASAGVIQIITKRGEIGAPQFDLQISQGSNFLLNPRRMIGNQFHCPGAPPCTADEVIRYNILDLEEAAGFGSPFSNGYNQRYNVSVRGGTDQVNYFVSADYTDENGIRSTNWNNQFSGRANIGLTIGDALSIDVSMGYLSGETRYGTGLIESGGLWPHTMWAQGRDFLARGYLAYTPEEFDQPEATRAYTRFTGSLTVRHNPVSWLDQRLTVGIDRGEEESQTLFPRDIDGAAGPWGDASLGKVEILRPLNTQISFDYGASARYSPNDAFSLTTSVGVQYYASEFNRVVLNGIVFPVPSIRSIEGATETSATQTFRQQKSLGLYIQQEIGWNDRVFLTGAIRGDDSSTFGSGFDAAIYPKLSGTWVISEESFWNLDFINSLRLRSAWGKAGRQPQTFAAVTLFRPSIGSGSTPAITPQTFGNPDVGPEIGTEVEFGFDIALLDDRLSTEFTYYYQKITDALVSVPLAPSEGFPGSQAANLGQLDNWGYEVALNAQLYASDDWSVNLGFQLAYTMNEIKDLGGRTPTTSFRQGLPWPNETTTFIESAEFSPITGFPTNQMCDAGISMAPDPTAPFDPADPDGLQQQDAYGWAPGGDIVPCAETRRRRLLEGPEFSPWTWSANGTVTWGDLQVFAMVDAEHGRWLNDFNISCRHDFCGFPNSRASMLRDDPIFVESSLLVFRFPQDARQWADYDASYIRLREIGLRYQLPEALIGVAGADRASFSLAARNLWYLWRKTGRVSGVPIPSPEIANPTSEGAFSLFQWPPLTTFEATLRVSF